MRIEPFEIKTTGGEVIRVLPTPRCATCATAKSEIAAGIEIFDPDGPECRNFSAVLSIEDMRNLTNGLTEMTALLQYRKNKFGSENARLG